MTTAYMIRVRSAMRCHLEAGGCSGKKVKLHIDGKTTETRSVKN